MKIGFIFGRNLESPDDDDDDGFSAEACWSDCAGCYESAQDLARMLWYVDVSASVTDLDDLRDLNLERFLSSEPLCDLYERTLQQIVERVSLV